MMLQSSTELDGMHGHQMHLPDINGSHIDKNCGIVEKVELCSLSCGHGGVDS